MLSHRLGHLWGQSCRQVLCRGQPQASFEAMSHSQLWSLTMLAAAP